MDLDSELQVNDRQAHANIRLRVSFVPVIILAIILVTIVVALMSWAVVGRLSGYTEPAYSNIRKARNMAIAMLVLTSVLLVGMGIWLIASNGSRKEKAVIALFFLYVVFLTVMSILLLIYVNSNYTRARMFSKILAISTSGLTVISFVMILYFAISRDLATKKRAEVMDF